MEIIISQARFRAYSGRARDPVDAFIAHIEFTDGCWLFRGYLSAGGYGRSRVSRETGCVPAHRFGWETFVGPIPGGLELDHVSAAGCTHRNCVNPDHLEPVSPRENTMRGRGPSAINAAKTHCINGHALCGPNLVVTRSGKRQCLTCRRALGREWARRKREAARA